MLAREPRNKMSSHLLVKLNIHTYPTYRTEIPPEVEATETCAEIQQAVHNSTKPEPVQISDIQRTNDVVCSDSGGLRGREHGVGPSTC